MKLIRNLDEIAKVPRRGAISIGNFDGVHRGHARIVKRLVAMAAEAGGPAIVFTFDPHPVRLLRPEVAPPPLTWIDRKAELLGRLGIDFIVAYPTTPSLLELSAEAFFQQIVIETLGVAAMAEGPNFCFGKDRLGTIERLQELCEDAHVELEIVDPLMVGSTYVSSSRTRDLLREGDVDAAVALLTEPYRVRGIVTHGAGRGGGLGFPTANIEGIDTLVPAHGVYAGRVEVDGRNYAAAINIGPNPTFGERMSKFEVHLIGYDGALYGAPLEIDFISRLRDVQDFPSREALIEQLRLDVAAANRAVANYQPTAI